MWKCTKCLIENEEAKEFCINCNLIKPLKTPLIVIIANCICSLNVAYLIIWGLMSDNINDLFWIGVIGYGFSLIGLWQMKKWGLYTFFAFIAFIIFIGNGSNLQLSFVGAFFGIVVYISNILFYE
jgi:hypothetical protein